VSLHPTMKRRLHERLHPLIGEEEADALLDEISPQDAVTREWLEGQFDRMVTKEHLDERLERFGSKEWTREHFATKEYLDARIDRSEQSLRATIDERFKQHTYFTVGAMTFVGVVAGVVQAIIGG
jgi:hypothetical protein